MPAKPAYPGTPATAPALPIAGLGSSSKRIADVSVWRDAVTTATELPVETKALLLLLAQRMNADGTRCFPGLPWLLAVTGRKATWVHTQLRQAKAAGYLGQVPRTGHHGSNAEYFAMIPADRLIPGEKDGEGRVFAAREPNGTATLNCDNFTAALAAAKAERVRAGAPFDTGRVRGDAPFQPGRVRAGA